jgi:pimeloyl-ACP methyl ester carboxylesterase
MPKISANQYEMHYDEVGAGVLVIFIHGHPFNRSMWRPQVEVLQSDYRVVTFDLRGYGESSPGKGVDVFGDFAQDLAALLDALDIETAVIAGLSMGGQIAFETWAQFSKRVKALVLADTFAQLDSPERKQGRYDMADRLVAEGLAAYADETLPKMIAPSTIADQPAVAQHVLEMMRTTPSAGAAAALRARAERQDYTPLLSGITVPALIVVGRDDEFTPVSDAELMHEHIPDSRLVVIEGAGHMPNLEQPAVFNQALLAFLNTLS